MSFALPTQFPEAANITGTLVFSASSLTLQAPITPVLTATSAAGFTVTPLFEPFDLTGKVPGVPASRSSLAEDATRIMVTAMYGTVFGMSTETPGGFAFVRQYAPCSEKAAKRLI
ncbi:MAG TPA: hypothetical protein VH325_07235 [Bryobacteraceae bacterium]|nr:hypothetical protein [Bryobacteraceae bacterium]